LKERVILMRILKPKCSLASLLFVYKRVYSLSFKYIPLDVPGNTRLLPVLIHYIANDYRLPVLLSVCCGGMQTSLNIERVRICSKLREGEKFQGKVYFVCTSGLEVVTADVASSNK
jgi:hypothetical protein